MEIELLIQNGENVYIPILEGSITLSSERSGSPATLKFSVVKDGIINFTEGNAVRLTVDDNKMFYGFVFTKRRNKDGTIEVTAYDQLRYLKNKDTIVYTNKTASEVIKMIASDFQLQTGEIEETGYKIPSRIEENEELFEVIQNALDLTFDNRKELYILYDDFGKITLKNISSMIIDILIDEESAEDFDYSSSIDEDVYNKIKLTYDNEETGAREVYIAKDSSNINSWGVLQYFDTLEDNENGEAKADALLELYNVKTRKLSIKNVFGDCRVRAGVMLSISLNLGDIVTSLYKIKKCINIIM